MADNEMPAKRLRATGTSGLGLLATAVDAGISGSAAAAAPAIRVSSPVLASPSAIPARRAAARWGSARWADSDWA